jgi:hypothetical protein
MPLSSVVGAQSIIKPGVCTSSTRPASPYDGQVIYETDTDKIAVYDASAWVYKTGTTAPTNPGLVFITGASFTAASSVSAPNNTFTSSYRLYKIVVSVPTASATLDVLFRFRVSGTDVSSNDYRQTTLGITSSGTTTNALGDRTSFYIGQTSSSSGCFVSATFDVVNPTASSISKSIMGGSQSNNASNHLGYSLSGQTSAGASGLQAFDSFSFLTSTGNITGFYRVYGYSES